MKTFFAIYYGQLKRIKGKRLEKVLEVTELSADGRITPGELYGYIKHLEAQNSSLESILEAISTFGERASEFAFKVARDEQDSIIREAVENGLIESEKYMVDIAELVPFFEGVLENYLTVDDEDYLFKCIHCRGSANTEFKIYHYKSCIVSQARAFLAIREEAVSEE